MRGREPAHGSSTGRRRLSSIFDSSGGAGVCIIAEIGVNHDGDVGLAHDLVDVAAECGADVVKFQTFEPTALVSDTAEAAPYQSVQAGVATQMELLLRYVLPGSAWPELVAHAHERGLEFMSTAFDPQSLDLVCSLGVGALKLGSGELTNKPLLTDVASRGLPVICSTGMGTEEEVSDAVAWLSAAPGLALMHCLSSYPAPLEQANLRAIPAMAERFGLPVGWSDHTLGELSAVAAVAVGATFLEKHITLDRTRPGPDHSASADPAGFASYVTSARSTALALGDGVKRVAPVEAENRVAVRRSWHATRDLRGEDVITAADVVLLRPATGLPPRVDVVGRRLREDVPAGHPLTASVLESSDE